MVRIAASARGRDLQFAIPASRGNAINDLITGKAAGLYPQVHSPTSIYGMGMAHYSPVFNRWYDAGFDGTRWCIQSATSWYGTMGIVSLPVTLPQGVHYMASGTDRVIGISATTAAASVRCYVSTDGTTFTATTAIPVKSNKIAYGAGAFVVSAYNQLVYSLDGGDSFTQVVKTGTWYALCWSATYQKFIAISSTGLITYSTDGITWTDSVQGPAGVWRSVAEANGVCIAVGDSNVVMRSTNGTDWTAITPTGLNTTGNLNHVCYVPTTNVWVTVSSVALTYNPRYSSDNGEL